MTERRSTLRRLGTYLWMFRWTMCLALVLTIASNVTALYIPRLSGNAIDAITAEGGVDFAALRMICRSMIILVVLNAGMAYAASLLVVRVSSGITMVMRRQIFDHLLTLPVSFFDHEQAGDIISRISYDVDTINTSLSSDLIILITSAITVTGSFWMMVRIAPQLCIIFVFVVPLIIFVGRTRALKVRPLFHKRSVELGILNGLAEELLSGIRSIKAYGREETMADRFNRQNQTAVDAFYIADYEGSIVGTTVMFVNNLSMALVSGFGALMYLFGQVSLGNISSFLLYSRRFSGPISEIAGLAAELQSALSAAQRVFRLLDEPSEPADGQDAYVLDQVKGEVVFDKVRFAYDADKEILHGISFRAEPGQMIAIVGPTGAGKTTIVNLLMRFYDIGEGTIMIDGHHILECTRDSVREQFSMVLQETWLFEGSICENIAYGNGQATREDVEHVCREAHIHDFIMSLKDGYDTILTDSGINISKGQKQLLTIARTMLSDAKMLILDEATSNVDSHTEQLIQDAMLKLCRGRTTFIIAHRLSTIERADRILVLDHGSIIERGTHAELLEQCGFYASLFHAQWENLQEDGS